MVEEVEVMAVEVGKVDMEVEVVQLEVEVSLFLLFLEEQGKKQRIVDLPACSSPPSLLGEAGSSAGAASPPGRCHSSGAW